MGTVLVTAGDHGVGKERFARGLGAPHVLEEGDDVPAPQGGERVFHALVLVEEMLGAELGPFGNPDRRLADAAGEIRFVDFAESFLPEHVARDRLHVRGDRGVEVVEAGVRGRGVHEGDV